MVFFARMRTKLKRMKNSKKYIASGIPLSLLLFWCGVNLGKAGGGKREGGKEGARKGKRCDLSVIDIENDQSLLCVLDRLHNERVYLRQYAVGTFGAEPFSLFLLF